MIHSAGEVIFVYIYFPQACVHNVIPDSHQMAILQDRMHLHQGNIPSWLSLRMMEWHQVIYSGGHILGWWVGIEVSNMYAKSNVNHPVIFNNKWASSHDNIMESLDWKWALQHLSLKRQDLLTLPDHLSSLTDYWYYIVYVRFLVYL